MAKLLESRNIRDDEVSEVIGNAEETGQDKFYNPETGEFAGVQEDRRGDLLGSLLSAESGYVIHSAYWHKSILS